MTNAQKTSVSDPWAIPDTMPAVGGHGSGRTEYDVERWATLVERTAYTATTNGWNKSEVARRSDVPNSTFSAWFSGKHQGRLDAINRKVGEWLESAEESLQTISSVITKPKFIMTKTAQEIFNTMGYAHSMSKLVGVTLAAGMGKTATCNHYCQSRPHAHRIVMRPNTRTVHGMLVEVSAALGIQQHNPAKLDRAIGDFLSAKQAPSLLAIDEAQNLNDEALDQIRYFTDEYECGIALVGNDEIYRTIRSSGKKDYAQIKRRFAKTLKRKRPYNEDIDTYIAAWKVTDKESVEFLRGTAVKAGALGNISETMEYASLLAAGDESEVSLGHIQTAWRNRPTDDLL